MSAGQLFADPHQFSVPIYQRPYSWSVDEAARLLDDVAYAAGLDEGRPIDTDYFLGAILLLGNAAEKQSGELVHRLEIVDGQQRMVTLTILASALRDLEPQPTTETAQRLDGLVRSAFGGLGAASRLELSGTDRDFFAAYVQDQGSCARIGPDKSQHIGVGQRAVLDARDRLVTELAQFTIEQRAELANYICDKCHFVVVITSDIDRAHRIFMVLNDRGRPLQRKDILKAEILKAVDPPFRGQALRIWSDAEQQLGDEMENFFSHLRTAFGYGRQQVIGGVRSLVQASGGAQAFLVDVFQPLASAYALILSATNTSSPIPEALRRPLVSLQRLKGREWVPAALHVLSRVSDQDQARSYLDEIERAAFLMRLVCLGSSKRQTRFARIAAALAAESLPAPADLYEPSREELRTIAYNLRDLHSRNVQACKALLLRLNDEFQTDALHEDPVDYTVEHVLPQRPKSTSLWREWFPDSEQRIALTSSLGNLVLVSHGHNDRARNDEYSRKKEIYDSARSENELLVITADVLANDEWRAGEIRQREAKLVSLLNHIWRLNIETARLDEPVVQPPQTAGIRGPAASISTR
jgi:uncharacterized protein DUF262/uncharacterized protein DUF1524